MQATKKVMDEEIIKLGLKSDDFNETVNSKLELIESVLTSGRLFRKSIQYIILKELRICFRNSKLDYSDSLEVYFNQRGRKKQWKRFRDSMELKTPNLEVTKLAVAFMGLYVILFVFFIVKSALDDFSRFIWLLGNIPFDILILSGIGVPLAIIYGLGRTDLPARTIDGLIDKIVQENIYDLLTSDKRKLREILERELRM